MTKYSTSESVVPAIYKAKTRTKKLLHNVWVSGVNKVSVEWRPVLLAVSTPKTKLDPLYMYVRQ